MSGGWRLPEGWRGSLRLRLLAGTLAWIVATIAVAGWGLSGLFGQHLARQFEAELATHLEQLAGLLVFDAQGEPSLGGELSDPRLRRPYSGLYWQVDGTWPQASRPAVLRSRSLWDFVLSMPPDTHADGRPQGHRVSGPRGEPLLMIERVVHPAEHPRQGWRLVVAADEALLAEPLRRFNRQLVIALVILAIGLSAAAVMQVVVGLRPLARLQRAVADLREGRASSIAGRFPSEVQPLVGDFNDVLARNAEMVARARTQAGNLGHALKTPLAVMANAASNDASELGAIVREQVATARVQVDHHLARARAAAAVAAPGMRTPVGPVLDGLLRVMRRVHAERGLEFAAQPWPPGLEFNGEAQDLQEMIGNLLDNACKWAGSRVDVQAGIEEGELRITVDDDGPGLPEEAREAALGRGVRMDERTPGSGLGLAIVRDLARLYGGDVSLGPAPAGGLRAVLRLPAGAAARQRLVDG